MIGEQPTFAVLIAARSSLITDSISSLKKKSYFFRIREYCMFRHSNPKFNFGFNSSILNISWGNIHRSQYFNQILI